MSIRAYGPGDLRLLERLLGEPAMTALIGGPETLEVIRARHERYLRSDRSSEGLFTVVAGPEAQPVGWVGYWQTEWSGHPIWECGWSVLPERQRAGVATAAARLLIAALRARGGRRFVHAFPAVENEASNALCRRLGFELGEEATVEVGYGGGRVLHCHHWRLDLLAGGRTRGPAYRKEGASCPTCGSPPPRGGKA